MALSQSLTPSPFSVTPVFIGSAYSSLPKMGKKPTCLDFNS